MHRMEEIMIDKKGLYNIMDNIDSCMMEVEQINRLTKLLKAGFDRNDNDDGSCAVYAISNFLESVEKHLAEVYTEVDLYIINHLE